ARPTLDIAAHGAIILSVFTVTSGTRATLTQQEKYGPLRGSSHIPSHSVGDPNVDLSELSGVLNNQRLQAGEVIGVAEILYEYRPVTPIVNLGFGFSSERPLKLYSVSTFFRTVVSGPTS